MNPGVKWLEAQVSPSVSSVVSGGGRGGSRAAIPVKAVGGREDTRVLKGK